MGRIRMAQTIPGCMDGIHPKKFIKDQEYEIDDNEINSRLAKIFLNCGAAVSVRARKPIGVPEKAVIEEAPEIKPQMSASEMRKIGKKTEIESDKEPETDKEPESKDTRVYQLSDELGISWKKIVRIAKELGFNVKTAQAGLTNSEVEKIKAAYKK